MNGPGVGGPNCPGGDDRPNGPGVDEMNGPGVDGPNGCGLGEGIG